MGFIDAFKRWRLAKKGMSSGKKRRVQHEATVVGSLDRALWLRVFLHLIFCVGAGVLALRAAQSAPLDGEPLWHALFGFFVALGGVGAVEMSLDGLKRRNGRLVLFLGGLLAQLALVRAASLFAEANGLAPELGFLVIPFVLAPMIHAVLLGVKAGVISALLGSLLGSLLVVDSGGFIAVSLICGLVVVGISQQTRKRVQLLKAGFYAGLTALVLALVLQVIDLGMLGGSAGMAEWTRVGYAALAAMGSGMAIALLVSGFLPVLEGMFRLTTDISWLELSDLNHRLLKRMQLEAPGTFHHSLVVASLAEAAAEAVGANAAMCRVCAYFHDIGKLNKPEYFIENQHEGQENPHDSLTPTMSALIIVAHVKDGVDLALKHKLNPRVIDVIKEHHGDSLVSYFYRRAQEQKRTELEKVERKLENPEDLPKIDEKNFRYPGPKPRSRESGIISIADAVESASRSLKKPTPAKIVALIEDLVEQRICDGQLDDCQLTLRDLSKVKEVFAKTLRSMLHSRIDYPKDEEKSRRSDLERKSDTERREDARIRIEAKPEAAVARDAEGPVDAMRLAACWGR